jgi:hypothetical protein
MSKFLFFDTEFSGHHSEYIEYIFEFIIRNDIDGDFVFIIHPDLRKLYNFFIHKMDVRKTVVIVDLSSDDLCYLNSGSSVAKSIKQYKVLRNYTIKYDVDYVYMLYLNIFQFSLIFYRPDFIIFGILFHPFVRVEVYNLKDALVWFRKYLLLKLMLLNPKINRVFILSDERAVEKLNKLMRPGVFKLLADPLRQSNIDKHLNIHELFNLPSGAKLILLFGEQSDRKGTLEVIQAMNYLNKLELLGLPTVLLIVGRAKDLVFRSKMLSMIQNLEKGLGDIVWLDEFVSTNLMLNLFNQCTLVLLTYKRAEASSGVFGHAIVANKRVICTNKGFLGEMVIKLNLGVVLDSITPQAIGDKIVLMLHDGSINIITGRDEYLKFNTADNFARTLLC